MWAELLCDHGPAHELGYGEQLDELRVLGDLGVARVALDAVDQVGLLVVVRREDDEVDDALQNLCDVLVGEIYYERT